MTRSPRPAPSNVPSIHVSAPGDLVELAPYLLGFVPEESMVVVWVSRGRIRVTLRVDLAAPDFASELARAVFLSRDQVAGESAVAIAYSSDVELAEHALATAGMMLGPGALELLLADGTRWRSLFDEPDAWRGYDLAGGPLACEAVFHGLPLLPHRADLMDLCSSAGDDPEATEALASAIADLAEAPRRARKRQLTKLVEAFEEAPHDLAPADRAELAALVADVPVRDVAWSRICRDNADAHVDLWSQVVRASVGRYALAPLGLLGMAAWQSGNGALQVCCVTSGEQIDPDYGMLRILSDINARALPPETWEERRA